MNISIRQLRAFSAVARLGSFVEASKVLHVTPAALSLIIRELETAVGFRLFDRTTRRVALSEAGQQYFHYAERILIDLRKAELFAEDLKNQKTGVVRIAMTQVMNWTLLPPVFTAFQQRWPQVRIDPVDVPTDQIIGSVETGQADLSISFQSPVGNGIEATPLFTSRVHAVFHGDHPLARRKSLRWDELNDLPIIFIGRGSELRIRAELPAQVNLSSRYEVDNTITALALVASGAGIAICAGYVRPMTTVHGLRTVPLTDPVVNRRFMLYRNRARAMAPAVEAYRDFLVEYHAGLGDGPLEDSMR